MSKRVSLAAVTPIWIGAVDERRKLFSTFQAPLDKVLILHESFFSLEDLMLVLGATEEAVLRRIGCECSGYREIAPESEEWGQR